MELEYEETNFLGKGKTGTDTVPGLVNKACTAYAYDYNSTGERAAIEGEKAQAMLARLIEVLAEKKILSVHDLQTVFGTHEFRITGIRSKD